MLALIVVGFVMATLGVALLLLGEVPFLAGKRIPALRARLIGLVLVGFLPLALGVRQLSNLLFEPETVEGPVLTWSMFAFCWLVVIAILFRVMVPKRPPRKVTAVAAAPQKNPFGDAKPAKVEAIEEPEPWPEPEPVKKPTGKKSPKPSADEGSPFDFS